MQPRTAIIILIIVVIIASGGMYFLYQRNLAQRNKIAPNSNDQSNQQPGLSETQKAIEFTNQVEKNNPVIDPNETPAEREARIKKALEFTNQVEKSNPVLNK